MPLINDEISLGSKNLSINKCSINQGIIGCISGSEGLDSSGLSSSAAVSSCYLIVNTYSTHPQRNLDFLD